MSLQLQRPTHLPSNTPDSMFVSPKRKRDTNDPMEFAFVPSPIRLRTSNLPISTTDLDHNGNGDRSPPSTVAGHFRNLNLTGYGFDFSQAMEKSPLAGTIPDSQDSNVSSSQESVRSSSSQHVTPNGLTTSTPTFGSSSTSTLTPVPLEIPETPRLKPITILSPIPSPISRPKSPPPLNLWWADTEITGHDPKDPTDDGYGINGVGFLPTPAMASARAERRKRQVAEWKNREAREARQRRSEARRRRDMEMANEGLIIHEGSLGGEPQRRVRFLEV
ncbi:MAG: hypothetical protein Q9166_007057 [cf. Caloplaca sp. 2 TL-2023]